MARVEWLLPAYDLAATLDGGQAFRWRAVTGGWAGVILGRWVRLEKSGSTLRATTPGVVTDWSWLLHYLAAEEDLTAILATFPADAPLDAARQHAPGLRLLRQEPWECLASFILSSTKQIPQIQDCIRRICETFGDAIPAGANDEHQAHAFPPFARLARTTEAELRACKMGFRAKYLLGTARLLTAEPDLLRRIAELPTATARAELIRCPGVGPKIADCVLLFAYGRQDAFPVDVWVAQALRHLYFPRARRVTPERLRRFSATYFGSNAGYAQQYLFHYVRTGLGRRWSADQRRPAGQRRSHSVPKSLPPTAATD